MAKKEKLTRQQAAAVPIWLEFAELPKQEEQKVYPFQVDSRVGKHLIPLYEAAAEEISQDAELEGEFRIRSLSSSQHLTGRRKPDSGVVIRISGTVEIDLFNRVYFAAQAETGVDKTALKNLKKSDMSNFRTEVCRQIAAEKAKFGDGPRRN